MAKPRVFISSTYYDLKQTRADIATFISQLGFEPVRNEEGNIPYGNQENLQNYCYKEILNVDILISIIGGRFGSESQLGYWSVSNEELKTAIKNGKQVYIFIEKNVAGEYETYLLNKTNDIKYKYVDDKRIYQFIEEIKELTANNNIKSFETSSEIQAYLKEQMAGLFQSFLSAQIEKRNMGLATQLENTARTLSQLVEYLKESNKDKEDGINKLLKMNHPFVVNLAKKLNLSFGFWIDSISDLNSLLESMSWNSVNENSVSDIDVYSWQKNNSGNIIQLDVASLLFDSEGRLLQIQNSQWKDSYITVDQLSILDVSNQVELMEELPF